MRIVVSLRRTRAVFSVELAHRDAVIDYICNQKQHYITGKLRPRLEAVPTEPEPEATSPSEASE